VVLVLWGREIDYTAEAANAQRFAELYGGIPDIFIPRVYTELSTSKVRPRLTRPCYCLLQRNNRYCLLQR
jgi:hypothetical protein